MLSELQWLKFAHRFTTLDINGSGCLELSDYAAIAANMCHACSVPIDSGVGLSLRNAYIRAFKALSSGREDIQAVQITLDEFIRFMEMRLAGRPEVFDRGMKRIAGLVADICDVNRDGFLDEKDFICFLGSYSIPEGEYAVALRNLGMRSNGPLSREDFISHSRDFYCGDNPLSPGNWLFGDFKKVRTKVVTPARLKSWE
ncbi:EF-hand domain-containing protein [Streptomyces sp. NPDC093595]|uniref:EF-hand domain-containing protein n=1 Tax=Streptomyces sp. NPDC093595 TaxID=3366045 RepID=UPI0038101599